MEPLLPKINFAPTVGVAPGTTTMELGQVSIGELPGQQATVQGQGQGTQIDDPYASDSRLSGPTLSDGTPDLITGTILDPDAWGPGSDVQPNPPVRWGLVALTAMTVFAGVVGWGVYARSRGKRDSVLGDGVDAPQDEDPYGPTAEGGQDPARLKALKKKRKALRAEGFVIDSDEPLSLTSDRLVPKDDSGCLKLGRRADHGPPEYRFGEYEVCLTDNQKTTLFGKRGKVGKKLGCGLFACAYNGNGSGKVVKFTRDPADVAALMKAQGSGVVPKLYSVYEIMQGGRNKDKRGTQVYAMTLEKLKTLGPAEADAFNRDVAYPLRTMLDDKMPYDEVCQGGCVPAFDETLAAVEKLDKLGIEWRDVHAGNVGYDKRGVLKVLDAGVSKTQFDREPDVLEGAALVKLRKSLGLVKL